MPAPPKEIPTIDLSAYLDPCSAQTEKDKVIEQVKSACEKYGFLQITGHGVPLDSQKEILSCCDRFFALPLAEKEALSLKNSPSRHGYERLREQVLNKEALADEKEGLYIGSDAPVHSGFRRGPNQWPSHSSLPPSQFQTPVMEYYAHMLRLAKSLSEILILSMGSPISVAESFTTDANMSLKLLRYPPHTSTDARQFGAAEHTDFGVLTILLQQPGREGLQVLIDNGWADVPAREDVFVVNLGDLTCKWTNGRYRSTMHRVVNRSGGGKGERYSVPCFFEGNLQARNPFDLEGGDEETVEMHIRRRLEGTYNMK